MKFCFLTAIKKIHLRIRLLLSFSAVILLAFAVGLIGFISLINTENARINAYIILILTVIIIVISILLCRTVVKFVTVPFLEPEKENTEEIKPDIYELELNPVKYKLSDLLNGLIQLNSARLESRPVQFKIDVKENLPSKLFGDVLRVKQAVNSLLSNAIKHTKEGEVSLAVRYIIADENIMLKFIVKDSGCGIKDDDKNRLFSGYKHSAAEETESCLFIVKKIVEAMDGTITVESEYGKGSVFTATLWQTIDEEYIPIGKETAERLNNQRSVK